MKIQFMLVLAAVGVAALSQAAAAAEPQRDIQTGAATRQWLALQKSGTAAPAEPRPQSGEVADQVYQRYLKSFGHPIPENFSRDRFVGGGGGSGG